MRTLLLFCVLFFRSVNFVHAQVDSLLVDPPATDPHIARVWGNHVAYRDRSAKPLNKLLLMIVGTGAAANHNIPFFNFAAAAGYHVISIDYKNTVITTACSNSEDSSCFDAFRQEIVFGEPVSPLVEVDSINSIYHRVYALLLYLGKTYPKQGWRQYLVGQQINWPNIIVAGHSQGAGHAAYLGKKFPVYRVLIFAGPQDFLVKYNAPAGWLSHPTATAPERYYSFLHLKDPYDYNKQRADCLKLMPLNIATSMVQPGKSIAGSPHILVTDIPSTNPHEAMMQPAFSGAWAYLLSLAQ